MPIARDKESLLICTQCGHINPATNKFCGNCGNGLVSLYDAPPVNKVDTRHVVDSNPIVMPDLTSNSGKTTSTPEPPPRPRIVTQEPIDVPLSSRRDEAMREEEEEPVSPISGPSFLGLSSDPTATSDYLLMDVEEEPRKGGAFRFLMVLAILALIVVGALEWQAIRKMVAEQSAKLQAAPAANQNQGEQPASSSDATAPNANPQATPSASQPSSATQNGTTPLDANSQQAHPLVEMDLPANGQQNQAGQPGATPPVSATPPAPTQAAPVPTAPPAETATPSPKDTKPESDTGPLAKTTSSAAPQVERASSVSEKALRSTPAKPTPAPKEKIDPARDPAVLKAERYLYGEGVSRNCTAAKSLLQEAADRGNPAAMSHLGAMYSTGQCISQDRTMAYIWFSRAYEVNPQNQWLEKNLTMLWRDMSPAERQVVLKAKSGR